MSCFQMSLSDVLQYMVEWTCNATVILDDVFCSYYFFTIFIGFYRPVSSIPLVFIFIHSSWRSELYEFSITPIPTEFWIRNYLELIHYLN